MDRLGKEFDRREANKLAVIAGFVFGPQLSEGFHRFTQMLPAFGKLHAHNFGLLRKPAGSDPEEEPPVRV